MFSKKILISNDLVDGGQTNVYIKFDYEKLVLVAEVTINGQESAVISPMELMHQYGNDSPIMKRFYSMIDAVFDIS